MKNTIDVSILTHFSYLRTFVYNSVVRKSPGTS